MDQRQQNSAAYGVLFFMADADDHISGKTGLTPTVTVSKNGGAFAAAAGSVSEVGSGWYVLSGNASDRDTLGELVVHGQASGADPADRRLTIVPWDPFDGNLGLPRLDAAITTRADAADYTPARAVKLDNLDATISSRSTLTAAGVWANATRTITGTGTGAITAASFAANAIDSAALATSAVTEIQTGLATLANQATTIAYVDELESRLSATRAANLDNLDATVSSRSTLTAGDVWANATRTITGTTTGAIIAASFAANAIDATALAASAVTEIQAGLATLANQATIISHVDDLEDRLTAVRAANLDNLDATVSSRLAASCYVAPDNVSIQTIEAVLSGPELVSRLEFAGGQNSVAGAVRDFRRNVADMLLAERGLTCGPQDVIRSGGPGYRLNEWIVVPEVDGDDRSVGMAVSVDESAEDRRNRILAELHKGERLRAPAIAARLGWAARTIKRELDGLRADGVIEFVGPPKSGYYRIRT